ncbi:DUF6175 family protein [Spirochaeta dissipatitropha]
MLRKLLALSVFTLILLLSCASRPAGDAAAAPDNIFYGRGEAESFAQGINAAKMDAVRQAVIALVGEAAERENAEALQRELYSTRNPNSFVQNDRMEILQRENVGTINNPHFIVEIEIPVQMNVVQRTLDSMGITRSTASGDQDSTRTAPSVPTLTQEEAYDGADAEQARFLQRYIENMTYMVFYPENSNTQEMFLRQAVVQANSYLAEQGYTLIDASQVDRLRRDREMVFEAEAQREVSLIQWIAQQLNADVYLEVEADVSGSTQDDSHYGSANITIRIYETSTAQLLGSVPFSSQRTFSRSSQQDAISNAVQSAVYGAMPTAVRQSQALLAQSYARGVRYEMVLLNTRDARVMSQVRSRLRDEVSMIDTISQTADETRYAVYMYGSLDELEDLMYDLSFRVPGMENLYLVMRRGKSITFDMGM